MGLKGLAVFVVVAQSVAHGMRILALDDRPRLAGLIRQLEDLVDACIHGAHNVCGRRLRSPSLVMHWSGRVSGSDVACATAAATSLAVLVMIDIYSMIGAAGCCKA